MVWWDVTPTLEVRFNQKSLSVTVRIKYHSFASFVTAVLIKLWVYGDQLTLENLLHTSRQTLYSTVGIVLAKSAKRVWNWFGELLA